MDFQAAIKSVCDAFVFDFGYYPAVGAELECYITPVDSAVPERANKSLIEPLDALLKSEGMGLIGLDDERGVGQVEFVFHERYDAAAMASCLTSTKNIVIEFTKKRGLKASFAAKPFAEQPGSGLHLHLSLHSEDGSNLYFKRDSLISDPLKFSIGGMLTTMSEAMIFFAPNADSYQRFAAKSKESPTTVSWGANNRTTALRLPESRDGLKHIEHRVSGSDCDPAKAMLAMLAGAYHGLRNRIEPPPQVFGDAFEEKYGLPRLPTTLKEAERAYSNSAVIADFFSV